MLTIEYLASPADVRALHAYCWKRSAYFRRGIICYAIVLGLLTIAFSLLSRHEIRKSDIFTAIAVAVVFPLAALFLSKFRTQKQKRTLSIDMNGLSTSIGSKRKAIPWSDIADLAVTEEQIFLVGRTLNGFSIPRDAFRNDSERDEFIGLCRDRFQTGKASLFSMFWGFLTPSMIVCLAAIASLYGYGRPLGTLLYTKWQAKTARAMWVVPTPLVVASSDPFPGKTFSYFGYEFKSPWSDVVRERKMESGAILNFDNGAFVSIMDGSDGDELQALKQGANQRGTNIANVFGAGATASRYALRSKLLNITPKDLHIFSSRQEMAGNSMLLLLKSIQTKNIKGGLYSFETPWTRGFQEGAPAQDDPVVIEAFDAQDHLIEIWVGCEKCAKSRPSQTEINRILYSLRPISTSAK